MARELKMTPEAVAAREAKADLARRRAAGEIIKPGRKPKGYVPQFKTPEVIEETPAEVAPPEPQTTDEAPSATPTASAAAAPTTKPAPAYAVRPIAGLPAPESEIVETRRKARTATIPSGMRPKPVKEDGPAVIPDIPAAKAPVLTVRATIRRVRALIALGFSGSDIAAETGISNDNIWHLLLAAPETLKPATIERVAAAYKKLASRPPLADEGTPQGVRQRANRELGRTLGWATFWKNFDEETVYGIQAVGQADIPILPTVQATAATDDAALTKAKAHIERLKTQLHDAEVGRTNEQAAANEKIAGLDAQLDEAAREISRLKEVEVNQNTLLGTQGAELSRLRLDREEAIGEAMEEIARLRSQIKLLRLQGGPITLALGEVEVPGTLVSFDHDAAHVTVALPGAEGKPQTFDLGTWSIAAADDDAKAEPPHLSLVSA